MAFDQLDKFTDTIAKAYKRKEESVYLGVLSDYYSTVLSHAKFRSQRAYCEKVIKELCPAYHEGFFQKPKK